MQVLPLERVISCVQDTLVEIAHLDDLESGVLRQKYLLHFLYKYISRSVSSAIRSVTTDPEHFSAAFCDLC